MSAVTAVFFPIVFFLLLAGIHVEGDSFNHRPGFCRHARQNNVKTGVEKARRTRGAHFGYRHVEEWSKDYPTCLGSRQSPVDLRSAEMGRLEIPSQFRWQGYEKIPTKMTLQNNGHTVQLSTVWEADDAPCISGGVLVGEYAMVQLHFHWGPRNDIGSEHTIDNRSLPLEMHMVHYKKIYGSVNEATKHEDGFAVLGVLFMIGNKQNRGIAELESYANSIKAPGSQVEIKPFALSEFDLDFPGEYVSYLGSLTTPPCSEIVTWILPALPRHIPSKDMDFFRSIQLTNGDDHNCRPTMPLNGRTVYYISY